MIKEIEVEFNPTPEELVKEIWEEWDEEQQADFLYELARLYNNRETNFLTQLQYVSDEINNKDDVYNKASIVRMLETVLEYVKEEGEKDGQV